MESNCDEKKLKDFIDEYNRLKKEFFIDGNSESELFRVNKYFEQETGGRLNHYFAPALAAVGVILVKKDYEVGLLGVIRGISPFIGGVAIPGGYVDDNELPKAAAAREVFEETGLKTELEDWSYLKEETANNHVILFYKNNKMYDWYDVIDSYSKFENIEETKGLFFIKENTELCFATQNSCKNEINKYIYKKG